VVEDSANPDSSPFVVNANGKVVVGAETIANIGAVVFAGITLIGTSSDSGLSAITQARYDNNSVGGRPTFFKSRAANPSATPVSLINNDNISTFQFYGDDGSAGGTGVEAARITVAVDGEPTTIGAGPGKDMPGRLVFSTTADGASSPTERMRITSDGKVGIGTDSPSQELVLSNDQNATTALLIENPNAGTAAAALIQLSPEAGTLNIIAGSSTYTGSAITGGASGAGVYTSSVLTNGLSVGTTAGPLKFFAGSTTAERMRIASDGKVGIGTTTPSFGIDLVSSSTFGSSISTTCTDATAAAGPYLNLFRDSASPAVSDVIGAIYFDGKNSGATITTYAALETIISSPTTSAENGILSFKTTSAGTYAERMRIDPSGNVGIGTTTVQGQLHIAPPNDQTTSIVVGRTVTNTDRFSRIGFTHYAGTTEEPVTGFNFFADSTRNLLSLGGGTSHNNAATELRFFTAVNNTTVTGTERMRIDSSGKVGIGTISPNALLEISSLTGSATPTPTELRISTATAAASDWSDSLPWGRMSFYNADASDSGPKIQGSIDAVSDTSTGGRMSMVFNTSAATTGTLTERMRIDSFGSVGIGMIPVGSTYSLSTVADKHVSIGMPSNSWSKPGLRLDSGTNAGILYSHGSFRASWSCNGYRDTSDQWTSLGINGASGAAMIEQDPLGIIMFRTDATRTTGNPLTVNERMRIDAVGRVGIANTSPQAFLHVDAGGTIAAGIFSLVGANTTNLSSTPPLLNVMYGSSLRTWAPASDTEILIERNGSVALTLASTASSESSVNFGDPDDENVGEIIYSHADDSMRFNTNAVEAMRITSAKNLKIGGTVVRATTEGTNQLVMFNGTAPAGTLANGVSFYAASGEARVMDAAGNSTLLSPHDQATNEWIFHSKHTPTGKVLRIDVEKMLRFINDHFGLDMIQEFMEE
jgi:hypothetical protein